MHDIWNPWHGCVKYSEGCRHCYMYYLDARRGQDGANIYRTGGFDYPLQRDRRGGLKVQSGEMLRVCMTSDFFLAEADGWRDEAWDIIRQRPDVRFYLLTKRAERMADHLPADWGEGWDNVMLNVTCENDRRARERLPILQALPARHKGVMTAPLVGPVDLSPWIGAGFIEQVICGGENYDGARPCHYDWVKAQYDACRAADVRFCFIETGTVFVKDNKRYRMPDKRLQSEMAHKSGLYWPGRPIVWQLRDNFGLPIPESEQYRPHFRERCETCGSRPICNGCFDCGACERGRRAAGDADRPRP